MGSRDRMLVESMERTEERKNACGGFGQTGVLATNAVGSWKKGTRSSMTNATVCAERSCVLDGQLVLDPIVGGAWPFLVSCLTQHEETLQVQT